MLHFASVHLTHSFSVTETCKTRCSRQFLSDLLTSLILTCLSNERDAILRSSFCQQSNQNFPCAVKPAI